MILYDLMKILCLPHFNPHYTELLNSMNKRWICWVENVIMWFPLHFDIKIPDSIKSKLKHGNQKRLNPHITHTLFTINCA